MGNSQKGFIAPLLITVIVLLIIGGGIFIYKNKKAEAPIIVDTKTQQPNTQTTSDDKQIKIAPQASATNWKTYTNKERFFEFRYPEYATVNTSGSVVSETSVDLATNYNNYFSITTSPNDTSLCKSNPYDSSQSMSNSVTVEKTVIEDKIKKDQDEYRHLSLTDTTEDSGTIEERYYIVKNDICYMIKEGVLHPDEVDPKMKTDLDQIFSSFKFTK